MVIKEVIPIIQDTGKITKVIPVMQSADKMVNTMQEIPDIDKKILKKADKKTFSRIKAFSLFFSILILILLIYTIVNYNAIQDKIDESMAQQIGKYGYVSVFILAFLVEILPQPLVSAVMPFISGLIFGLDFKTLLIVLLIGAISSNYVAYFLGLRYGKRVSVALVGEDNYEYAFDFFKKYGRFGITLLALTPLPYFPILGGIFKMDLSEFTFYAIIPRIFHFLILSFILIYFFGIVT